MRKIFLLYVVLFLSGCNLMFGKKVEEPKKNIDLEAIKAQELYNKNKNEIDSKLNNSDFYVGEGVVKITDYVQDRKKAKEEALQDLSSRIETEVKVDIERTLSNTGTMVGSQYSEDEKDIIVKKSKIYAEHVITNYQSQYYDDYPKKGILTCLTWISVKEYEKKVKNDLNNNKKMIRTTILTGNKNFISGNYLAAAQNWIMAKNYLNEIFNGLPLQDDIDGDGSKEEVTAYLNDKILTLFNNVRLSIDSNEVFTYDASGHLNKIIMVYAQYIDSNGKSHPFAKLPLIADYIEGRGEVSGEIITGDYGQVELPIRNLDASNPIIRLRVKIDKSKIKKINLFTLPALSSVIIKMTKMKTIALSVTFINGGITSTPSNLFQKISSYILDKGFSVSELKIRKNSLTPKDFDTINKSNADYFMNVFIIASNLGSVGGYENIFKANCSGSVTLYKLPRGSKIIVKSIGNQDGFGSSSDNAGLNAYEKVVPIAETTVQNVLNKVD